MRFWDASAVVPLLVEEPRSSLARALRDEDTEVVVWWGTPVECASALARLRREGALSVAEESAASRRLDRMRRRWFEVLPGDQVRAQALRVLRVHALRAADALQLAAALEWAGAPAADEMVTFDERLAAAAELEGFVIFREAR